ncbi:MAG: alanine--tRNA ligase [Chloroflexi bacterium]|nr:alanine--tRNA ligase [Chloroflexota bacterium]
MASRTWTSDEVASTFLGFFRARGHLLVPSSSLVPEDDPTVLLTTAGMQQFAPYFVGRREPPSPRLCSLQKCFRTTDISDVGDRNHHTFFEMLGNFSVGDYFKDQMISWALELVTEGYGIPQDRLWVTIHPTDEEAGRLWKAAGLPSERIVTDESNFWGPAGSSGPCGPDTELYYDWGREGCGDARCCGRQECFPGCDCDRFLEFWNLVFMQFFQDVAGSRTPLARKNIDTGSGLERVTRIQQKAGSSYETDLFLPIIRCAEQLAGVAYGASEHTDQALRVLADHGRAMTFLVGDGVVPSNEGRGYVLRRIVRRAVRYGRRLGIERPFLGSLVEAVAERMTLRYPALGSVRGDLQSIVRTEEQRFLSTLQTGLSVLERWIEEAKAEGRAELSGDQVFRLYDTYGFPRELSEEIMSEAGMTVAAGEYEQALEAQRERSRGAARFLVGSLSGESVQVSGQPPTVFRGYDGLKWGAGVLALDTDGRGISNLREGEQGTIVLAESPFYPEGGGQVGDTGEIATNRGTFLVEDTRRDEAGHILHVGRVLYGEIAVGDFADARVDGERRRDIMRHHSVTHLLHSALHLTLGPQAVQAGSLVAPHVARFDFPSDSAVTADQLEAIEDVINHQIRSDIPVIARELPFQEAISEGALAFFGEKYGDRVRVVSMDDFSKELCGGTHVRTTGELGAAYVAAEYGIGSGMRRVEVVAGRRAQELARARSRQVESIAALLGTAPEQIDERVQGLLEELREARRVVNRLESMMSRSQAAGLLSGAQVIGGVAVVTGRVEVGSMDALLQVKDAIEETLKGGVIVLGAVIDGAPQFVASVSKAVIRPGLDAVRLVKEASALTGGGGGGRPELARAGGRDASKLDLAISRASEIVREAMSGD